MAKLRCGSRLHNGFEVPENVTVFTTPKGRDAYISARNDNVAVLRYVGTDEFIEVKWDVAIKYETL